jgi:hypothetical protein
LGRGLEQNQSTSLLSAITASFGSFGLTPKEGVFRKIIKRVTDGMAIDQQGPNLTPSKFVAAFNVGSVSFANNRLLVLPESEGIMLQTFSGTLSLRRLFCLALALAPLFSAAGCLSVQGIRNQLQYNDRTNDFVMGWRNSVWARQSWHAHKAEFLDEPQFYAFGEGYRAGYAAVASGGNGCPPPVAPRKFWNWRYQSAEGQAQVAAWFSGYPFGARAADLDGAGLYQQIQVSYPIERQYSPDFLNPPPEPADPTQSPPPGTPNNFEIIPIPQPNAPGVPGPQGIPPPSSPTPANAVPSEQSPPGMGVLRRLPAVDEERGNPFFNNKPFSLTALTSTSRSEP